MIDKLNRDYTSLDDLEFICKDKFVNNIFKKEINDELLAEDDIEEYIDVLASDVIECYAINQIHKKEAKFDMIDVDTFYRNYLKFVDIIKNNEVIGNNLQLLKKVLDNSCKIYSYTEVENISSQYKRNISRFYYECDKVSDIFAKYNESENDVNNVEKKMQIMYMLLFTVKYHMGHQEVVVDNINYKMLNRFFDRRYNEGCIIVNEIEWCLGCLKEVIYENQHLVRELKMCGIDLEIIEINDLIYVLEKFGYKASLLNYFMANNFIELFEDVDETFELIDIEFFNAQMKHDSYGTDREYITKSYLGKKTDIGVNCLVNLVQDYLGDLVMKEKNGIEGIDLKKWLTRDGYPREICEEMYKECKQNCNKNCSKDEVDIFERELVARNNIYVMIFLEMEVDCRVYAAVCFYRLLIQIMINIINKSLKMPEYKGDNSDELIYIYELLVEDKTKDEKKRISHCMQNFHRLQSTLSYREFLYQKNRIQHILYKYSKISMDIMDIYENKYIKIGGTESFDKMLFKKYLLFF